MRILRDPAAETAGAAVIAPADTKPEAKVADAAIPPPKVQIDPTDLADLYKRLTLSEAKLQQRADAERESVEKAERERLKAIGEKDGAEKALAEQERQWKEKFEAQAKAHRDLESSLLSEKKAAAIADALAGVDFANPHAERDARQKLDARFGVERDSAGKVIVRDLTSGRFAADSIPELIKTAEFDHFLKPSTRGGSGSAHRPGHEAADPDDPQAAQLARVKAAYAASKDRAVGL